MTTIFNTDSYKIVLHKHGADRYPRISFPLHSGCYTEVETNKFVFHFNLNDEIIRAKAKGGDWPHPHEWLKRTMGNDWVYYSTGGYTGVFEATGEYYLPNLRYPTNGLLGGRPFKDLVIENLTRTWHSRLEDLVSKHAPLPSAINEFFQNALNNTPNVLASKAEQLFTVCGGRPSVLPPDARHVDYNVIPLTIASGCLYKCRFCEVKNKKPFRKKSRDEIRIQLDGLKNLYGRDRVNYNALFLGEHDALQAGAASILDTLEEAYRTFAFHQSTIQGCNAFMFGSATSLMDAPESLFMELEQLPYDIYINIGLESADQATLDFLGKPLTTSVIVAAFQRIQEINDRYQSIEITSNFVMDDDLPENHLPAFLALVRESLPRVKAKGCVYLSPLKFGQPSRSQLFGFNRLKVKSRVPTFLYIIQRL